MSAQGTHLLRMAVLLLTLGLLKPKNRRPISRPVLHRLPAALVTRVAKGVCSANWRVVALSTDIKTLSLERSDPILLGPAQFVGHMLEARAGPGLLGQDHVAVFELTNVATRPGKRWYSDHWVGTRVRVVVIGNGSSTGRIVKSGTARVEI
ncbi:hypothetical protein B0T13DRAFT_485419 [Neurospora crassa]|nr:hypothetical protein B0T13DRAFT_485419 [Neurospora crassa]